MVFDSFRKLLGIANTASNDAQRPADPPQQKAANPDSDAFDATFKRRYDFWRRVGNVEDDGITHLISPSLLGGPAWPTTRQAYRIVRRDGGIIIVTDGLSDPFDNVEGGGNGFEMELFVETADIAPAHAGKPGDVTGIKDSWAFELVKHVADTVAGAGGIRPQLERYKVLSMELPGFSQSYALSKQLPPGFATEDDALGILIGAPLPDFPAAIADMPLSPVAIVPVVLVRADELMMLRAGGAEARRKLAGQLAASPAGHRINLSRPSLV
jgi:hypothetical protein